MNKVKKWLLKNFFNINMNELIAVNNSVLYIDPSGHRKCDSVFNIIKAVKTKRGMTELITMTQKLHKQYNFSRIIVDDFGPGSVFLSELYRVMDYDLKPESVRGLPKGQKFDYEKVYRLL